MNNLKQFKIAGILGYISAFSLIGFGLFGIYLSIWTTQPKALTPAEFVERAPESLFGTVVQEDDAQRSEHWETFARKCKGAHPQCAYCGMYGNDYDMEAHHKHAFKLMTETRGADGKFCLPGQKGTAAPGGELDPANIIILCRTHHLSIGHGGNYQTSNPNVQADCEKHAAELKAEGKWPKALQ